MTQQQSTPLSTTAIEVRNKEKRSTDVSKKAFVSRMFIVIGFFALWELLVTVGFIDRRTVSKPSLIFHEAVQLFELGNPVIIKAFADTLYVLMMAFVLGIAIGLPLGIVLSLNKLIKEAFFPIVMYLLGIPKTIFLPLFVLFFGLGNGSAIAFGTVLAFLQIAINVYGGVESIEYRFIKVAKAFNAPGWMTFIHVILPAAAPGIFAGLWHGLRNAFVGVLIAQMFVSNIGIGFLVKDLTNKFQIDKTMLLILISALLVIVLGTLWEFAERKLTSWRTIQA